MADIEKLEAVTAIVDSVIEEENNNKKEPRSNEEILNDSTLTSRQKLNEIGTNNLIPINLRSKEEQKRIRQEAGKRSGEVRRQRKTAKELLTDILTRPMTDEQIEEVLGNACNLLGVDKSAYNVMNVKALQCAMSGDTKAMQFIRDTVGDKPIDQTVTLTEQITEADRKALDDIRQRLG